MTGFCSGIITALATPFKNGGVNTYELAKMIEYQIEGGADGIVILGTTGEASTMTDKEKDEVLATAVKYFKNKIKIIVGTGSNDTRRAVCAGKRAEALGADGIIAVTPYYNKCTQRGIYEYYKAICGAVSVPVIAYNVPARTAVNITPETAERLADISNLAGIKEASGDMPQAVETMRRIRGKTDMFSGEDCLNLPILSIGGAGMISVVSNIVPALTKKIYTLVKENRLEEANEAQDFMLPLISALFSEVNPIPVKAAYNMIGFDVGLPRPPLTELTDMNKAVMRKQLQRMGLSCV